MTTACIAILENAGYELKLGVGWLGPVHKTPPGWVSLCHNNSRRVYATVDEAFVDWVKRNRNQSP